MLKKIIVVAGVAVAALAMAAWLVQGAKGRGVAVGEHGVRGHFQMEVKKRTDGHRIEVGGPFMFKARINNARTVEIHMPRCREFVKNGQVAEFHGPARAVFIEGRHRIVREGPLHVRVNDRRGPQHPGDPDELGLHFFGPNQTVLYAFAGLVMEGDIMVYEREGN